MCDTELHYLSRTEMHSDDKWYVEKYKLYFNLVWLLAEIGGRGGDVMGGSATVRPQVPSRSSRRFRAQIEVAEKDYHEAARRGRGLQQEIQGDVWRRSPER